MTLANCDFAKSTRDFAPQECDAYRQDEAYVLINDSRPNGNASMRRACRRRTISPRFDASRELDMLWATICDVLHE